MQRIQHGNIGFAGHTEGAINPLGGEERNKNFGGGLHVRI